MKINAKGGEPAGHGFTMAEILLSLTIIGVVAAITLPSLTGNINERTWNTQRKALYARMSQAIALMPALNGYGTLTEGNESTSAVDTAAETFVTEGLSKVLKINNICDSEHLEDCGIPKKITDFSGAVIEQVPQTLAALNNMFSGSYINGAGTSFSYHQIDTKAAAFETQNGESLLVYYNPYCQGALNDGNEYYTQALMCANFVYDLNGNKGPNTVGKDIGFMSVIYPSDSVVVAPNPLRIVMADQYNASAKCNAVEDSRVANLQELMSIFYNRTLINMSYLRQHNGFLVWSSGIVPGDSTKASGLDMTVGRSHSWPRVNENGVICVKR